MPSSRTFEVAASEYEEFRFNLPRSATVTLALIATDRVNILILDNEQMSEYENMATHTTTKVWNGVSSLREKMRLTSGTWHIIVEGHRTKSRGRIELSP